LKIYWSDRQTKPAPADSVFRFYPFVKGDITSTHKQQLTLPTPQRVKVLKRTFSPTKEVWLKNVEKALTLIQNNQLEKVVLARQCTFELDEQIDPFAMTAALKERAKGAFVFCLQTDTGAFLGASPERLFARKKRELTCEAVAGTRKRGLTLLEDELLKQELLQSEKDLREFSYVPSYLKEKLMPLCKEPLHFTPTCVHQTQNVQHLYAKGTSTLKAGVTDEQIIQQLHPTPALCGIPKEKAFSTIVDLEPFQRGLYGGILGWSTQDASEWIVGIRSCLIKGKTATLFSGTGIVEGSDPEKEWDELNQKIKLYESILDY